MTITEAIRKHGLEFLRGRAIIDGARRLYIHDKVLDEAIELWADEPENAYQQKRFYGSEVRNDDLVEWIYGNSQLADEPTALGSEAAAVARDISNMPG